MFKLQNPGILGQKWQKSTLKRYPYEGPYLEQKTYRQNWKASTSETTIRSHAQAAQIHEEFYGMTFCYIGFMAEYYYYPSILGLNPKDLLAARGVERNNNQDGPSSCPRIGEMGWST